MRNQSSLSWYQTLWCTRQLKDMSKMVKTTLGSLMYGSRVIGALLTSAGRWYGSTQEERTAFDSNGGLIIKYKWVWKDRGQTHMATGNNRLNCFSRWNNSRHFWKQCLVRRQSGVYGVSFTCEAWGMDINKTAPSANAVRQEDHSSNEFLWASPNTNNDLP